MRTVYHIGIQLLGCVLCFLPSTFGSAQTDLFDKAKGFHSIDSSLYYVERYLEDHEVQQDSLKGIEAMCYQAGLYMKKGLYERADQVLATALRQSVAQQSELTQAEIKIQLAHLNKYRGDYLPALNYYLEVLEYAENEQLPDLHLEMLVELAEYYRKIGKYDEARDYIYVAFEAAEAAPAADTSLQVELYQRAAAISNEAVDLEYPHPSIHYSRKAIELAQATGDVYAQAVSLNELGFWYKNKAELGSAEAHYQNAEQLWFSIGADREAVHAMNNRAMMYAHHDYPYEQIFGLYHEIIDIVETRNIDYSLVEVYHYLSIEYMELGDTGEAYNNLYEYHVRKMHEEGKRFNTEVANIVEKYENDKVKLEIQEVSGQLAESQSDLERKQAETTRVYIFLVTLIVLLVIIGLLVVRINRSNKKLKGRSEQNELLLKEIHHRVKNNLQIISSLLELQTKKIDDEETVKLVAEGQNRVQAMSLIHKKLYQNDNLAEINFQDYVEDLSATLYQVYKPSDKEVKQRIEMGDVSFDIDTAIPLGLMINELVSNSYKYAFDTVAEPELAVSIEQQEPGHYRLMASDNGQGLPGDIDPKKSKSIGLRLVQRLARQLQGSLSYENNGLSTFIVDFKDTNTRKLVD